MVPVGIRLGVAVLLVTTEWVSRADVIETHRLRYKQQKLVASQAGARRSEIMVSSELFPSERCEGGLVPGLPLGFRWLVDNLRSPLACRRDIPISTSIFT